MRLRSCLGVIGRTPWLGVLGEEENKDFSFFVFLSPLNEERRREGTSFLIRPAAAGARCRSRALRGQEWCLCCAGAVWWYTILWSSVALFLSLSVGAVALAWYWTELLCGCCLVYLWWC